MDFLNSDVMDAGFGTTSGGDALAWGCALGWLGAAEAAAAAEATTARPTAAATRPLRDGRAVDNDMGASFRLGGPAPRLAVEACGLDQYQMWSTPLGTLGQGPRQQLPNTSPLPLRRTHNLLPSKSGKVRLPDLGAVEPTRRRVDSILLAAIDRPRETHDRRAAQRGARRAAVRATRP